MALFTPDLFRLSEDGSRWLCTVSLRQSLDGVLHKDIVNKMTPDLDDTIELPEWHYSMPTLSAVTGVVDMKFDLGLYAPFIDSSTKENYYWDRAVLFISHYGLNNALAEPLVNLIMHEVLCKFSKWDKYCKDKQSYQKLMAYGSNFFCDKEYLKDILKVSF